MVAYVYPFRPFPFPEDLPCGVPYINWPTGEDLVLSSSIDTEVAIPESWVDVGVGIDGKTNITKEAYSLVMPRMRTITCDQTKFVPMYRNEVFETSDDKFIKPNTYYLEYIGTPATHTNLENTCDIAYHLLSFRWEGTNMEHYKLAKYEGNDWLFQLFTGDTETQFTMSTRNSLAESDVIKVCDGRGKHTKYHRGKGPMWTCDFPNYEAPWPTPCPTPIEELPEKGSGLNLGLAVGLPIGMVGTLLLIGLGWYFTPKLRRKFRGEGGIQL